MPTRRSSETLRISWTYPATSDSTASKQGTRLLGEPRPRRKRPRRGEGETAMASIRKLTDEHIKLIKPLLPKERGGGEACPPEEDAERHTACSA